jgi:SAM-dependent methyltransferase
MPHDGDGEAALPPVHGDSVLQSSTLEDLTVAKNYHRWLTSLALPYLGEHPIEFGSGLGDYAATWRAAGVPAITVTDPDASRAALLSERFADDPAVTARRLGLPCFDADGAGEHTAVVAFNVLEHVDDDVGALRSAARLVRPGSPVVIFVPAFPVAMSDFDRQVGHVRRYRRRSLQDTFNRAGLPLERLTYVNTVGLAAWIVMMRLLKGTPRDSAALRVYDTCVVPVVRGVESKVRPPFGQSLLAVGRVPAS